MNSSKNHIDYWIACSGGVDSVVLVRLFKELNKNFGILHCNFKLRRGDSEKDENFVRELADEIEVPFQVKVFDVRNYIKENGGNTQLAARNLRYQWFEEVKVKLNTKIVLGHHKDDQIETFFLQLRRGGKLRGLSCMPNSMNGYIRPLLNYSKDEIYKLARINNWSWREDSSNFRNYYKRNLYRNELIPCFENNNFDKEKVTELVADFQSVLKFTNDYLTQNFDFKSDISISFKSWNAFPEWMKHEFLRLVNCSKISSNEIARIERSQKGKYLCGNDTKIWNEGDHFKFQKQSTLREAKIEIEVKVVIFKDVVFEQDCLYLDGEKLSGKLSARYWQNGDVFQPIGMKGTKTISKFLRDKKIQSSRKRKTPVLVDENNRVLGVFGYCPDDKFKIQRTSNLIFKVKLK